MNKFSVFTYKLPELEARKCVPYLADDAVWQRRNPGTPVGERVAQQDHDVLLVWLRPRPFLFELIHVAPRTFPLAVQTQPTAPTTQNEPSWPALVHQLQPMPKHAYMLTT